jgi:hypothetical protein
MITFFAAVARKNQKINFTPSRVARWYIFLPKNPILGKFWSLVHFVVIWYFFPVLVCCSKKNLATDSEAVCFKSKYVPRLSGKIGLFA